VSAYYSKLASSFLGDSNNHIAGALSAGVARTGFSQNRTAAVVAWEKEIDILKSSVSKLIQAYPKASGWGLLLEYPIPRRQKRIDAVLLAEDVVLVLEFKVGSDEYDAASRRQAEDYALDLRDFHRQSRDRIIVPILVATEASAVESEDTEPEAEPVRSVVLANQDNLADILLDAFRTHHDPKKALLELEPWDNSAYHPVPTIIEAAEALFAGHSVDDIDASHSESNNLKTTSEKILETVAWAQANQKKAICFVTGVPGAGKTLAGLRVTHDPKLRGEDRAAGTFLSGNGPLVEILKAALSRDHRVRTGKALNQSERLTHFIENVHSFIRFYHEDHPDQKPSNNVAVFDEAQRAWDADKQRKKFGRDISEPEMMLSIMDRHDWAVIVALVGGGQEIHDGEAGLAEWGRALTNKYQGWRISASPEVLTGGISLAGHRLFERQEDYAELNVTTEESLHLPVSIRSFKAENVSRWVEAVLERDKAKAAEIYEGLTGYPIVMTRSLAKARAWLKDKARGEQRCGLVASSRALRLRADGLELTSSFRRGYPYVEWFLGPPEDMRSSYQLEVAASEFECQGLELDWVGVCWGSDFAIQPDGEWHHQKIHGKHWQALKKESDQTYMKNKYRVLMTRARRGMVIWIPEGDRKDETRPPAPLNATADFLRECGAEIL
jgi:hypothetical protein